MSFKKIFKTKTSDVAGNIPKTEPTKMDLELELLKNWVEDLRKIKNRDFIFRKLISAITYILSNGNPIQVNDKSTEIVKGDFLNFLCINEYPDHQVLWATEQVLSWYTKENPDLVMQAHVSNTINNSLLELKHIKQARPKTFKDKLIEKAERSLTLEDIQTHVEAIKKKMNTYYQERTFTVDLILPKPKSCIAFGATCNSPIYTTFVPRGCDPEYYVELFKKAFIALGFSSQDMTFTCKDFGDHKNYSIILKW